jgi:hypothetical protein
MAYALVIVVGSRTLAWFVLLALACSVIVGLTHGVLGRFKEERISVLEFLEYMVLWRVFEVLSYPYHVGYRLAMGKWHHNACLMLNWDRW